METNWQLLAEEEMKTASLETNDHLIAELLGFMPIPEVFVSEWIPGNKLIEAVENAYITNRDKIKLLDRLGLSPVAEDRLYAATSSLTSISTLELLAGDIVLPIRNTVKDRNHECLNKIITTIASQQKIAANWNTIPEELVKLADSKWSWIRQTVARNPFTPQDTLAKLASDESGVIQLAVARNYGAFGEVLDLLLDNYDEELSKATALNPNASEKTLLKLLPRYFHYISQREDLPSTVLAELLKYNSSDNIKLKLIHSPNTSGETLAQLKDIPVEWIKNLVQHPNIFLETLEELAKNPNPKIHLAVFESSKIYDSLRTQLLEQLLNFRDYTIRLDLALSFHTPGEIRNRLLEELMNAREADLQIIAEGNNSNKDLLDDEEYLDDEDEYEIKIQNIWQKIAESENTPVFILEKIANKEARFDSYNKSSF